METALESRLSVEPKQGVRLSEAHKQLLTKLDAYEAPYLQEKLLNERKFDGSASYNEAFVEFKKYVGLVAISGENLGMLSKPVDEVWHQFILFTKKYMGFCDEFVGEYLHHSPNTSHTPLDPKSSDNLIRNYKTVYGKPSPLWDFKSDCDGGEGCDSGDSSPGCAPSGMCSQGGGDGCTGDGSGGED